MTSAVDVPLVRLERLTKRFPRVLAVDGVSIDLLPGQIHALVGENGAGKTTLMNLLYGVHQPDDGRIVIDGEPVVIRRPADAISSGVSFVRQHFALVPSFTVADNLMLAQRDHIGMVPDRRAFATDVARLGDRYGLQVDPDARVSSLPLGLRQRVELLGGLVREARVLILDEPTTVLPPPQIQELFATLRQIASEGRSVVLITHRLAEVFEIGDWFSVMRGGRLVRSGPTNETTTGDIARLMVGRNVDPFAREHHEAVTPAAMQPVLQLRDVTVHPAEGSPGLRGVSFDLRPGEIVGVAGVEGNGQKELVEAIGGLKHPASGSVVVDQEDISKASRRRTAELGVGIVPEDRQAEGLILQMSLTDNVIIDRIREFAVRGPWLSVGKMRSFARGLIESFGIRTSSESVPARMLSGGNQQKVVLARVMSSRPRVLVAAQPTRGLDVAATTYVLERLVDARNDGAGVILISSDLDQVLALADRIVVLYKGELVASLDASEATREMVGLHMAGLGRDGSVAIGGSKDTNPLPRRSWRQSDGEP